MNATNSGEFYSPPVNLEKKILIFFFISHQTNDIFSENPSYLNFCANLKCLEVYSNFLFNFFDILKFNFLALGVFIRMT